MFVFLFKVKFIYNINDSKVMDILLNKCSYNINNCYIESNKYKVLLGYEI